MRISMKNNKFLILPASVMLHLSISLIQDIFNSKAKVLVVLGHSLNKSESTPSPGAFIK